MSTIQWVEPLESFGSGRPGHERRDEEQVYSSEDDNTGAECEYQEHTPRTPSFGPHNKEDDNSSQPKAFGVQPLLYPEQQVIKIK